MTALTRFRPCRVLSRPDIRRSNQIGHCVDRIVRHVRIPWQEHDVFPLSACGSWRSQIVNGRHNCHPCLACCAADCPDILYFFARVLATLAQPTLGRGGSLGDVFLRWGFSPGVFKF